MADNVPITAGSGTTIATDDVAGRHFQRMKLSDGTPDSENYAVVDGAGNLFTALADICLSLRNMFNALVRPIWLNMATGNLRTEIASGTVTTVIMVTTVTTVTTLNQLNGVSIKDVMIDQMMRSSWALNVRGRIT